MRKITLLSALALSAAVTLTSCSKETGPDGPGKAEAAIVRVSVTAPTLAAGGKAVDNTGNTLPADQVNNFTVFITDNTGEIKWTAYSNDGSNLTGASAISVSTDARHVYIVANGGDLRTAITTKTQLDNYKLDMGTAAQNQTSARWASGSTSTPLTFAQNASGDFEASTDVTLTFVAARISLKILNNMSPAYDGTNTAGELILQEVAVLNARQESKLFGASLVTAAPAAAKFYTGLADASWAPFPAAADYTVSPVLVDNIDTDDFTSQYYFYVFENNGVTATEFPTIITIRGEVNGSDIYYPVHLAPYEQLTGANPITAAGLTRGNSYDITIDLKVDPTDGGGGGVTPVNPIVTASVDVSVTLTPWVPVTIGKEFQ